MKYEVYLCDVLVGTYTGNRESLIKQATNKLKSDNSWFGCYQFHAEDDDNWKFIEQETDEEE